MADLIGLNRLFELLEKAWEAITQDPLPCRITAKGYLQLAEQEIIRLLHEGELTDRQERDLRGAHSWISQQSNAASTWQKAIYCWWRFWLGFESGQRERTLPKKIDRYYARGHEYGLYGTME